MDSKKIVLFIVFVLLVMLLDWLLEFLFCIFLTHSPFAIQPISNIVIPLIVGALGGYLFILRDNSPK